MFSYDMEIIEISGIAILGFAVISSIYFLWKNEVTILGYRKQLRKEKKKENMHFYCEACETSNDTFLKVVNLAKSKYGYDFDGKPPNTADAMYEGIAGLIGAIISKQNVAGGTLKQLIAEVKSGHNEYYAAQNEKNGTEWGGPINFYPSVDSEGQLIKQANKNWHITGSDS